MHELKRRCYLEAMGIDSYISRGQLRGAAATRRLAIRRRSTVSDDGQAMQPIKATMAVESSTATAFREAADAVKAQLGAENTPLSTSALSKTPAAAVSSFSIVAVIADGILWLEELSGSPVFRDQVHLIRAMAKALAMNEGELDVSQFDWPIHNNTQLDLGEDAARACLASFVQRKADQGQCRGLVLLGSGCREKLDQAQIGVGKCVSTVATLDMLRDPQLKKQAWLDLLPIANRS